MPQIISTLRIVRYAVASRVRAAVRRLAYAVLPHREWTYSAGSDVGYWSGGVEVPVFGNVAFVDTDGKKCFRW